MAGVPFRQLGLDKGQAGVGDHVREEAVLELLEHFPIAPNPARLQQ